jgi:hypothetical protein
MQMIRKLLFADTPTHCGKVFSLISLETLAKCINSDNAHRLGYVIMGDEIVAENGGKQASHRVLWATVQSNILVAGIETLDSPAGQYLANNSGNFIFRPMVDFFEASDHFSFTSFYYGINALAPSLDFHNSFRVMWQDSHNSCASHVLHTDGLKTSNLRLTP